MASARAIEQAKPGEEPWRYIQDSTLFRRGINVGGPSWDFHHIINSLEAIHREKRKISMLIVGVARGQEPLSILATWYGITRASKQSLSSVIDLHLVDIRESLKPQDLEQKISLWQLRDYFLPESVVWKGLEVTDPWDPTWMRVKPQVKKYLESVCADPKRAHWGTPVQQFLAENDGKEYDCIVYNNTHGHAQNLDPVGASTIYPALLARLTPGRILITDAGNWDWLKVRKDLPELANQYGLTEIYPGIYQTKPRAR